MLPLTCAAQSQRPAVELVRQLPDGNWLLKVDGAEVQTLTLEQKREVLRMQVELDGLRKETELLRKQVATYEAISGLFQDERAAREKESAALAAQLAIVNDRLVAAEALMQRMEKALKRNRVEAALSNPAMTLIVKLAVPLGNLILGAVR